MWWGRGLDGGLWVVGVCDAIRLQPGFTVDQERSRKAVPDARMRICKEAPPTQSSFPPDLSTPCTCVATPAERRAARRIESRDDRHRRRGGRREGLPANNNPSSPSLPKP